MAGENEVEQDSGNGVKKEFKWLHTDINELKKSMVALNTKLDDYFIKTLPIKEEKINEKITAIVQRLTGVETRIYFIVLLALILFQFVLPRIAE